jgi:hypothetical protein
MRRPHDRVPRLAGGPRPEARPEAGVASPGEVALLAAAAALAAAALALGLLVAVANLRAL